MNLILHHLRKDIHAQRWHLMLWLLVVITLSLPDLLILQPDYDAGRFVDHLRTSPIATVVAVIVWIVLLARLVQLEPVTGSTSFWLTRPVPRKVYLSSKLIFLAIFLILPSFLPIVVHAITFGYPDNDFWSTIGMTVMVELIGALAIIWLATYTPNLVYFAGMLCLGALALILAEVVRAEWRSYLGINPEPSLIFGYGVLALFLLSLIVEHGQRGRRTGFGIGIAGLGIGLVVIIFGPSPVSTPSVDTYHTGKIAQVGFESGWENSISWHNISQGYGPLMPQAVTTLQPSVQETGTVVWVNQVNSDFSVPHDWSGYLPSSLMGPFGFNANEVGNPISLQAALPGIALTDPDGVHREPTGIYAPLFYLPADLAAKVTGKTGTLSVDVSGQLLKLVELAVIPLNDPHYIARVPGGFIRIRPYQEEENRRQLIAWSIMPDPLQFVGQSPLVFVLVDPQTSMGKILKNGEWSFNSVAIQAMGSRSITDRERLLSLDGTEPLSRMVLHVFKYTPTADFSTTLAAPDFLMNPKLQP